MCLCILCSCRQKSSRVIIFNEFLQALQELAPKRFKGKSHEEAITAIYQLVEAGEPSKSGVTVRKTQDMTTQEPCLEFLLEKLHHFLQWKKIIENGTKKSLHQRFFFFQNSKIKKNLWKSNFSKISKCQWLSKSKFSKTSKCQWLSKQFKMNMTFSKKQIHIFDFEIYFSKYNKKYFK